MESAPPIQSPSREILESLSAFQKLSLTLVKLEEIQACFGVQEQIKVKFQALLARRGELDMVKTYRTALQQHEEQELKLDRSWGQLKSRIRGQTEWYQENIIGQWGHPMDIGPRRKIMTRSVTRSQTPVQSKEQRGMSCPIFRILRSSLTRYIDEALEEWKRSMDKLRDDDTAIRQDIKEEQARWAAEVTTNFRDAKALSEVAEASGIDLAAERASLQLLINEQKTRFQEEMEKVLAALKVI